MTKEIRVIENMFSGCSPKESQRYISNYVNTGYDLYKFEEEMSRQDMNIIERFTVIGLMWLKYLDKMKRQERYDMRNEEAVFQASQVYNEIGDIYVIDEDIYQFEKEFVEYMGKDHRTLQTDQTKIILKWLYHIDEYYELGNLVSIGQRIQENFDEHYFRLI